MLEKRLRLFSKWLIENETYIDTYHGGKLEHAIQYAKQEVKQEIGELLEEILNVKEEEIEKQVHE